LDQARGEAQEARQEADEVGRQRGGQGGRALAAILAGAGDVAQQLLRMAISGFAPELRGHGPLQIRHVQSTAPHRSN
jgi:hypothetical protein